MRIIEPHISSSFMTVDGGVRVMISQHYEAGGPNVFPMIGKGLLGETLLTPLPLHVIKQTCVFMPCTAQGSTQ